MVQFPCAWFDQHEGWAIKPYVGGPNHGAVDPMVSHPNHAMVSRTVAQRNPITLRPQPRLTSAGHGPPRPVTAGSRPPDWRPDGRLCARGRSIPGKGRRAGRGDGPLCARGRSIPPYTPRAPSPSRGELRAGGGNGAPAADADRGS
jgi:hypothetical protein